MFINLFINFLFIINSRHKAGILPVIITRRVRPPTAVAMKQTLGRQVVSTVPVKHTAAATPAGAAVASVYC